MRVLLVSNSTCHGSGYLDHCEEALRAFWASTDQVLFVPYALHDLDGYAAAAQKRLAALGMPCISIHHQPDPRQAAAEASAFFIGGGNTFRLLDTLYRLDLVETIRRRVLDQGACYVGSSAGSNVACASIRTTNDMPIVYPPTFEALGLVPFNLNPHYLDPEPGSTHKGETREQRIREFHEVNAPPVVGLREGAMLRIENGSVVLEGTTGARLFRQGQEPTEHLPGARFDDLLNS